MGLRLAGTDPSTSSPGCWRRPRPGYAEESIGQENLHAPRRAGSWPRQLKAPAGKMDARPGAAWRLSYTQSAKLGSNCARGLAEVTQLQRLDVLFPMLHTLRLESCSAG